MSIVGFLRRRTLAAATVLCLSAALAPPAAAQDEALDQEAWLAATLQALFTGATLDPDEVAQVLQEHFPPSVQNWLAGLFAVIAESPGGSPGFLLVRDPETGELAWTGSSLPVFRGDTGTRVDPDTTGVTQDRTRQAIPPIPQAAPVVPPAVPQTVRCDGDICGFAVSRTGVWALLPPTLGVTMVRDTSATGHDLEEVGFEAGDASVLRIILALDELFMVNDDPVMTVQQDYVSVGIGRFRKDVLVGEESNAMFFAGGNLLTSPARMEQLGSLGVQAFYSADLMGITDVGHDVGGTLHLSGTFGTGGSTLQAQLTVTIPDQLLSGLLGPYSDTLNGTVAVQGNSFSDTARLTTVNSDSLRYSGSTAGLDGAFFGGNAQAIAGAFNYNRPGSLLRTGIDAVGVFQGGAVVTDPLDPP